MQSVKLTLFNPDLSRRDKFPLIISKGTTGFPSPAKDFSEPFLDIYDIILQHPSATFYASVSGNELESEHILDNDILIIDRAVKPVNGCFAVCIENDEYIIKKINICSSFSYDIIPGKSYKFLKTEEQEINIWGIITFTLHPLYPQER